MFPRVIEQGFRSFCSNAEGVRDTVCTTANQLLERAGRVSDAAMMRIRYSDPSSSDVQNDPPRALYHVVYHPLTVGVLGGTTAICLQNAVRACWNRQYRNSFAWGLLGVSSLSAAMHITHIIDHPSFHQEIALHSWFA